MLLRRVDESAAARIGITASRKIGTAVLRNRAKRLVREAFRATRAVWPAGTELVVIVRRFDSRLRLADVVAEWRRAETQIRRCLQAMPQAQPLPAPTSRPSTEGSA